MSQSRFLYSYLSEHSERERQALLEFSTSQRHALLFDLLSEPIHGGIRLYKNDDRDVYVDIQQRIYPYRSHPLYSLECSLEMDREILLDAPTIHSLCQRFADGHDSEDPLCCPYNCPLELRILIQGGNTLVVYKILDDHDYYFTAGEVLIPIEIVPRLHWAVVQLQSYQGHMSTFIQSPIRRTVPYVLNNWDFMFTPQLCETDESSIMMYSGLPKDDFVHITLIHSADLSLHDVRFEIFWAADPVPRLLHISFQQSANLSSKIHRAHKERCPSTAQTPSYGSYRSLHNTCQTCYCALKLERGEIKVRLMETPSLDRYELCVPCFQAYRLEFAITKLYSSEFNRLRSAQIHAGMA